MKFWRDKQILLTGGSGFLRFPFGRKSGPKKRRVEKPGGNSVKQRLGLENMGKLRESHRKC